MLGRFRIPLFALLLSLPFCAAAQSITFKGRVIDDDTAEGIPFCDVFFQETNVGVSTDMDGYYEFSTENYSDTLRVSALGYELRGKPISAEAEQTINFRLGGSDFELLEVVVEAGENPANAIVRGIIANKKKNRVDYLDAYECEMYTKVELDIDNVEGLRGRKLMKPFEFVFENVDSVSDEKPFLPVYMMESLYDVYHVKGKGQPKEILQARKVAGETNATVNELINSMHEEFSVYDDWIQLLEKPFASPFSKMGLFYYEYYIMDSTYINGQFARKLKFKPKRKQESTFFGTFWVMDSTFAVQRLDMRMSPDVNINLVKRIIVYQEYDLVDSTRWLPAKQKVVIDFAATRSESKREVPGIIGRKTVSYKDYVIGKEDTPDSYKEKSEEDYYGENLERPDSFWTVARHDKLTETEEKIYVMIDSIENVPMYKTYLDAIQTLASGYKAFGPIELGHYASILSRDHIQGFRLQMGMWTSNEFSKRIRFGGYAGYAFKEKKVRYGGDLMWILQKRPRTHLVLAYHNDVNHSSESSEDFEAGDLFSGAFRRNLHLKLIDSQEGKISFEKGFKKGWTARATLLHRRMDPYGGLYDGNGGFNYRFIPDPVDPVSVDTTIATTEAILKIKYGFKEKFLEGQFFRTSLGSKYPILELQYAKGIQGVLNSQYDYHKLTFTMRGYFYMNPIGWTSYKLKAGKTFGRVPFMLADVHPGNETWFYESKAFNGMNKYEFASDTYTSLMLTHHFDGFFLNRIPFLRKLQWRTVATFRTIWGNMSEENLAANAHNLFDPDIDGSVAYNGFQIPKKYPYMEVGAGIENIFKVIRVDVMWRLNYLEDNPYAQPFTFRVGMGFYF